MRLAYPASMHSFAKYDGAGNDFVLLLETPAASADPAGLARRICPRETGVGVDGMVLVDPRGSDRFGLRFFNPDGTEFATCGNGSRCAARFLVDEGRVEGPTSRLLTADGEIAARVEGPEVALSYDLQVRGLGERRVELDGSTHRGLLLDVGTPHFVLPLPELPEGSIEEICRPIRHDPALGAGGANVDLVALHGPGRGEIRTFERGVEGETLACGSGAMASALALRAEGHGAEHLSLETRGGARLGVTLHGAAARGDLPGPEGDRVAVELRGPAERRFEGRFPEGDA